jgi:NAD+ synthase
MPYCERENHLRFNLKSGPLNIAIAQLNPVVGDITGNLQKAAAAHTQAAASNDDLIVFSELFITGYPPEDLVLKPAFQAGAVAAINQLASSTADGGPAILIGTPWPDNDRLYNAAALLDTGEIKAISYKHDLPNYEVFDEKRIFSPGPLPSPMEFRGRLLGVPICEDIWNDNNVCTHLAECGAEILIVPNGSPYYVTKRAKRLEIANTRVKETGLGIIYVNQTGGQDELVFDGASFALDSRAQKILQLEAWQESIATTANYRTADNTEENGPQEQYCACVTGLRDYVKKNSFSDVVIGLSGGIDSALCAAIAVDALGADKVRCVMMPYKYTSKQSLEDARKCANALEVHYDNISINSAVGGINEALAPLFHKTEPDITEENIQSRVRGIILMAMSNKFGSMVVTTGNKSEMSVGYATLYGDMNGGFNPIKDIYKTEVIAVSKWRNSNKLKWFLGPDKEVIPENIISKPPSAELREGQTDQDMLPPYEILDDILYSLIEKELPVSEIVNSGHNREVVRHIARLLSVAEYKRRQSAPGVKISTRSFNRDRRYPITNGFRE